MKNLPFVFALFSLMVFSLIGSSCGEKSSESDTSTGVSQEERSADNLTAPENLPYPIDTAKVVTLPSGLQYYMLQEGYGNQVKAGGSVLVHYHGMLTDGTVFDSSFERNQPIELSLQQVIRGWQEGLPLCKVGAKIVLIVPPDLGYGASAQNKIPANSTLIFNIEVLGANS
jgi:FKBP-type peptidyl-prolyl cis-trans isomerase FkpA